MPGPERRSPDRFRRALEILWVIAPTVITLIMLLMSTAIMSKLEEIVTSTAAVSLKAEGYQWYWGYEFGAINKAVDVEESAFTSYLDPDENYRHRLLDVDKKVELSAGTSVRLSGTGIDVIHSWAVPSCGVKIDCVPGKLNTITFTVLETEKIMYGQCSELCGINHAFMPICLKT